MTFANDLKAITDKADKAVDRTIRAVTVGLFSEVITRTPVGDPTYWKFPAAEGYVGGRLKGNWQVSIGLPASGVTDRKDKSGAATIAAAIAGIGSAGSVTYMANNLPYAQRIEYDGWSKIQAPAGMVRVSFARIDSIVRKAAAANKV